MPAATPSSIVLCLACLLACAAPPARADDSACPARHAGRPLEIGYVLDGQAEDESVVMPDASGQQSGSEFATWLVERIYDKGRQVTLECHYGGSPRPVFVPVTKAVTMCSFGKTKGRAVTLGCE